MAISKYIEWLFTSMILHYGCLAYDIDRDVCLETAFDFALGKKACKFTLAEVQGLFESEADISICSQKCHIKINNLEYEAGSYIYGFYELKYQLKSVVLSFNGLSETLTTINTRCSNSNEERTLEISVNISENLCTSSTVCEEESRTCCPSLIGQVDVCICQPGYIGFGNKCFKGNLKLNEPCTHNEQCSVVFGSVCQNDTCVCGRGYVPLNDSECISAHSGGNSQASIPDKKEDNVVSVTFGSVFGGLILGIILTVLTMTIYHHIRHGKPTTKEREYPKVTSFNNTSYETEIGKPQRIPAVYPTNERKVVNVPPFAHSVEMPMNRNTQEATKRSMANNDVNNDVYNHLHEKEEDADIDENYDHAHGNPSHAMGESNYSNLNTGGRSREPDASEHNDYNVLEPDSDYFSLKKE